MYESAQAIGNVTLADALILFFQVLLAVVGALVRSSVNDMRERIVRLEDLVMGRDSNQPELPFRKRRG